MKHFCSFSEAIREGANLHPQGYYYFFEDGETYAFGAGREAIGGHTLHYSEVYRLYPYLDAYVADCPACGGGAPSLARVMFHLNDDHKWTREAIADWLESEEEKLGFVTLVESESKVEAAESVTVS